MMDKPDIVITVSRPPSANRMWRVVPGMKRPVLDRAYAAWLDAAGREARRQYAGQPRVDCRFNAVISVPVSRRDTDNWVKPILDLLQHAGVISNDGNMHRVEIEPTDRADCSVALFVLPEMGGVRSPTRGRKRTGGPPAKPSRKQLAAIAALRKLVPF